MMHQVPAPYPNPPMPGPSGQSPMGIAGFMTGLIAMAGCVLMFHFTMEVFESAHGWSYLENIWHNYDLLLVLSGVISFVVAAIGMAFSVVGASSKRHKKGLGRVGIGINGFILLVVLFYMLVLALLLLG